MVGQIFLGTTVWFREHGSNFLYRRRHGDSNRLEDLAANSFALTPDRKALTGLFDRNLLQGFQILFDVDPFKFKSAINQKALDCFFNSGLFP